MKWLVRVGLVLSLVAPMRAQTTAQPSLAERAKHATAILVAQNESGGMDVRCTVTAFEKGKKYKFVSAAHCVGTDDVAHEKVASSVNQAFYITFDETGVKTYYAAKVLAVGYQHRGDDFSVYEVDPGRDVLWTAIGLGDEKKEKDGAAVINVAAPQGLGIQVFRGNISSLYLDRPVVEGDINWRGALLLQMPGTNGGSSGSSIISVEQEKIVAFLVGTIGGTSVTAVPVSRFKDFLDKTELKTYRWAIKDDQAP